MWASAWMSGAVSSWNDAPAAPPADRVNPASSPFAGPRTRRPANIARWAASRSPAWTSQARRSAPHPACGTGRDRHRSSGRGRPQTPRHRQPVAARRASGHAHSPPADACPGARHLRLLRCRRRLHHARRRPEPARRRGRSAQRPDGDQAGTRGADPSGRASQFPARRGERRSVGRAERRVDRHDPGGLQGHRAEPGQGRCDPPAAGSCAASWGRSRPAAARSSPWRASPPRRAS